MATVEFRYDPKNTAWFTANAAMVLKAGEPAYHDTTGLFKLGDGVTALSALSFLPIVSSSTPTIQQVLTAGNVATTTIETTGFIKTGGTSAQFLKADGTVDSSTYLTTLGTAATSLTTNNSSGASTLIANVLNVPNYTLAGLGGTTLAAVNAQNLSVFAATTSSQLAGVISDETGTGSLVFGTSPTFTTNITTPLINGTSGTLQIGTTDLVNIGNAVTASQRLVRIGQDTAWGDIGSVPFQTNYMSLWLNQTTPTSINYALSADNLGSVRLNSPSGLSLFLKVADTTKLQLAASNAVFSLTASAFGAIGVPYTFNVPANTNQTLGTNIPNFRVNGANKQWATGALATQYFNYFTANTVSFVGASTATNVYGLYVEAATAGTNATITNNYAAGFGGNILINTGAGAGRIRSAEYSSNLGALYFNQTSPDGSNYAISGIDNANTLINAKTTVNIRINGTDSFNVTSTVITYKDAFNIAFNTTTGTKIGTTNLQKLSFWNATPIVQPTTAVAAAAFVANTSLIANDTATFDGYTIGQIVKALRNAGLLA
jgi:hypothetical protein